MKCKICKQVFYVKTDKTHKGLYCSRECYFEGRWGHEKRIKFIKCLNCGTEFMKHISDKDKFCSKQCADKYRIGKPLLKRRRRLTKKCEWCGKIFDRPITNFHSKHYFCCHKCSALWWAEYGLHGKNHPNWIGGKYNPYFDGWKMVRKEVLKKYNNKCAICGKTGKNGRIEIHHIKPLRLIKYKKTANRLKNLIALCPKCHNKTDRIIRDKREVP